MQSGLFHEFHRSWSVRIKDPLSGGLLLKDYYALVEQKVGRGRVSFPPPLKVSFHVDKANQ